MAELRSVEQVLDYAIAREREAYDFYTDLATRVTSSSMRDVLEDFAADELQHRIHLEAVRNGETEIRQEEVGDLEIADELEPADMREAMSYKDALALAIKREAAAQKLYAFLAGVAEDEKWKETFELLAQEEKKHRLKFEFEYDLTTF